MLKLHGFAVSNYFNMVQLALHEKGIPFEIVTAYPDNSPEFLAKAKNNKVPCLETEHGYISETSAILEYLEDTQSGPALLPADSYARAQVRTLMREIELYIELPARSCFGEAFFGRTLPDAIKEKGLADLRAGFATLKRQAKFAPYVAGDSFTLADIYFLYSVSLASRVAQTLFQFDPLEDMPEARALMQKLGENPHVQSIAAAREQGMADFIAKTQAGKN